MPRPLPTDAAAPSLQVSTTETGAAVLRLAGVLDAQHVETVWKPALDALQRLNEVPVVLDATGVRHADGAGIALLLDLLRQPRSPQFPVRLKGLDPRYRTLLDQFDPAHFRPRARRVRPPARLREVLGRGGVAAVTSVLDALAFIGESVSALVAAVLSPRSLRWRDTLLAAQRVGADALPIVSLISFESGFCGFADCLVVAKHARQGCDFTATFDRGMRKLPGVKVL